jgi:hypothetical protein
MTDDSDLIELALRVVQKAGAGPESRLQAVADTSTNSVLPSATSEPRDDAKDPRDYANLSPPLRNVDLVPAAPKQVKSPGDLAAMILDDLSKMEGCPQQDVQVTVYGSNPWNSWLRFGSGAGPVPSKTALQDFCSIITERMRRLYDVSV